MPSEERLMVLKVIMGSERLVGLDRCWWAGVGV
jgi:hypothetical protein